MSYYASECKGDTGNTKINYNPVLVYVLLLIQSSVTFSPFDVYF